MHPQAPAAAPAYKTAKPSRPPHVTRPPIGSDAPTSIAASTTSSTAASTTASMKRKAPQEPPEAVQKRPPRQDPVSCESCRRKKLKCNRQQPCSSCMTRRLTCTYGAGSQAVEVRKPAPAAPEINRKEPPVVVPSDAVRPQTTQSVPARPVPDPQPSRTSRESLMTADWLENIHMGDRVPTATPSWLRSGLNDLRKKESSLGASPGASIIPPGAMLSMPYGNWTASSENPATINLLSFLPKKPEAMALFQYYFSYIDYLYHIILPKRVSEQIDGIYRALETGSSMNMSHVAIFFSIAASSVYLQQSIECPANAELCSQELSFLTGAALIQSNYTAYPTLEGLQAAMVVAHNVSNLNAHPSVSALFEHGAIVNQAKNLMLHVIDSPRCKEERESAGFDVTDLEAKRRLWWDITAYDWLVFRQRKRKDAYEGTDHLCDRLLGFLSGPQEWTYLINPDHMNVQHPLNIDDEAIDRPGAVSLPESTPTDMSFALQRLKLAVVCRNIVDATTYEHLHGSEVSYTKILEMDRKLHEAHVDIPEFFRLDPASRRRFSSVYQERPTIAWQRCLLQQGYFSRFCRLHRQFFIRGAREPAYSYSHVVCLQSARKVLEIKRIMDEDEPRFQPPSSVIWSVMHHVFMAAVILLLDVCFNWDDILAEKRKEEVLEACRMLSKAQQSSSLVKEGINAMMSVLQKHWKSSKLSIGNAPPNPASSPVLNPVSVEEPARPLPVTSEFGYTPGVMDVKDAPEDLYINGGMGENGERQLEDVWSEMLENGGNLALEATDWTGLLTELTNATLPCG